MTPELILFELLTSTIDPLTEEQANEAIRSYAPDEIKQAVRHKASAIAFVQAIKAKASNNE